MYEHSYDRRYNFVADRVSQYTDSIVDVVEAVTVHGLVYCHEGYADRIYHDETVGSIGGTEIIRRTDGPIDVGTVLPPWPPVGA